MRKQLCLSLLWLNGPSWLIKPENLWPEKISIEVDKDAIRIETSMMWPSQNFLLYNRNIIKMKVTEWINNLKKYVQHVQIITI